MGPTTRDEPAPIPDIILPIEITLMLGAKVSNIGPITKNIVVSRIVSSLPYLLQHGPATRAPRRPPSVKMEETTANWSVFIEMHWGRLGWTAELDIDFFAQVMTP